MFFFLKKINFFNIVIKYYFVSQHNILCIIGYEIPLKFIPPSAVFYTAGGGFEKLTL